MDTVAPAPVVKVPVSVTIMANRLPLPDGSRIIGATYDSDRDLVVLDVANHTIPPDYDGEPVRVAVTNGRSQFDYPEEH